MAARWACGPPARPCAGQALRRPGAAGMRAAGQALRRPGAAPTRRGGRAGRRPDAAVVQVGVVLPGEAGAAAQVDRGLGHPPVGLARAQHSDPGRQRGIIAARGARDRRVPCRRGGGLQAGEHGRALVGDGLEGADRAAELLALVDVADGDVQAPADAAGRLGCSGEQELALHPPQRGGRVPGKQAGRAPRPGAGVNRAPRPGAGVNRAPRPGAGVNRAPRPGAGVNRAPRPGAGVNRAPRPGAGVNRAPRPGAGVNRAPRPGAGVNPSE